MFMAEMWKWKALFSAENLQEWGGQELICVIYINENTCY